MYIQTLEIQVPDNKTRLVKEFLKEQGVTVKVKNRSNFPNSETLAAMNELKRGNGVKFKSTEELFTTI